MSKPEDSPEDELDDLLRDLGFDPDNLPGTSQTDDLDKLLAEVDELVADLNAKNPEPAAITGDPELDALLAELDAPKEPAWPEPPVRSEPEPESPEEAERRRFREANIRIAGEPEDVALAALLEGEPDSVRCLHVGVRNLWRPLLRRLAEEPRGAISAELLEAFLSDGRDPGSWLDRSILASRQLGRDGAEPRPELFQAWLIAGLREHRGQDEQALLGLDIWRLGRLEEVDDPVAFGRECVARARAREGFGARALARLLSLHALRALESGLAEEALDHAREAGQLLDELAAADGDSGRDDEHEPDRQEARRREVAALFALERLDEAFRARGEPKILRRRSELETAGIVERPARPDRTPKQAALEELGRRAVEPAGFMSWLGALAALAQCYAGTAREARLSYYLECDLARAFQGDPRDDDARRTVLERMARENGWTVLESALNSVR